MSKLLSKLICWPTAKLAAMLIVMGLAASGIFSTSRLVAQQPDLPAGKGVEAVRAKCLVCHEADLITQQRLARAGWVREVDKMIRWGAAVSDAEKEEMADYLAANFGLRPAPAQPALSDERGLEIFKNKCTVCHETDLTEQQRLTRAGWVREVEKMIRWGAAVSDVEKDPLVDYLAKHFGPRKESAHK